MWLYFTLLLLRDEYITQNVLSMPHTTILNSTQVPMCDAYIWNPPNHFEIPDRRKLCILAILNNSTVQSFDYKLINQEQNVVNIKKQNAYSTLICLVIICIFCFIVRINKAKAVRRAVDQSIMNAANDYRDESSFHNDAFKKTTDWAAGYIPIFNQHFKILNNSTNEKTKILDAGCAIGQFASFIYDKLSAMDVFCEMSGFDIQKNAIKQAKENNANIIFKSIEPFQTLPFKADYFDIIICTFVISTMSDNKKLKRFFQTLYKVINKKHGKFIVVVNNPKQCVDTRFAGIQICVDPITNKIKPDPLDKVIIKFYEGIEAEKPFIQDFETWRPTEMIANIMKDVFGNNCIVSSKDLRYIDEYEQDITSLGIALSHIQREKEQSPFSSIICQMNCV